MQANDQTETPVPVRRLAYRIKEVAEATGMSESAVRNLIRKGELPARRLNNMWLIPAWALEDMFAKPTTEETETIAVSA